MYNEKVMDHFTSPENISVIENSSSIGAKFQTFSCGDVIASNRMTNGTIKDKALKETSTLSNKAAAESLNRLPRSKMHCLTLSEETIRKTVDAYLIKSGREFVGRERMQHLKA